MGHLGKMVEEIRQRAFVGRDHELEELAGMLLEEPAFRVAYVHGMGGIGKTELLRAFARQAEGGGWSVRRVDTGDLHGNGDVLAGDGSRPCLVLLDSFDLLGSAAREFRKTALPALASNQRLLAAG